MDVFFVFFCEGKSKFSKTWNNNMIIRVLYEGERKVFFVCLIPEFVFTEITETKNKTKQKNK